MGLWGFFPKTEQQKIRHPDRRPMRTPNLGRSIKYEGFDHTSFQLPQEALPGVDPVNPENHDIPFEQLGWKEARELRKVLDGHGFMSALRETRASDDTIRTFAHLLVDRALNLPKDFVYEPEPISWHPEPDA